MEYRNKGRMARKEAVGMEELISQYIRSMKLSSGLNRQMKLMRHMRGLRHRVDQLAGSVLGVARHEVKLVIAVNFGKPHNKI